MLNEVDGAVARCFRTDARSAELEALAGEHALELVGELLIHSEQIANLAATNADVASGNVHVGTDVAIELSHEGLAETHDLSVALAAGCEIRAALAAAHRQRGECILEGLLEAEEFQDRQVNRGVEAKTAFVRANSRVELHAVANVDLHLTLVVDPGYTEGHDALGLNQTLDGLSLLELGMLIVDVLNGFEHFFHCLQKLRLTWVLALQVLHDFYNFHSN